MEFGKNASQINETFVEMLQTEEMKKEAERRGSEYLKVQIYEDSFMERILPAQPITAAQCDRSVDHPNYQVVIDKEFNDVRAITTGLRGLADYQYIEMERSAVNFSKIESDEYEITEGELRGARQPVPDLIRHHTAYHIRKQMDKSFRGAVEAAISVDPDNQAITSTRQYITPEDIIRLRNLLDGRSLQGRYLKAATLLMTVSQFNWISSWVQSNYAAGANTGPGMAGGITQEFWKDGYTYNTLLGLRVVTTHKTDVIPENVVYCFTEPEYMGHHFTFNDDRFAIMKHYDRIKWKAWRTFGFTIGNHYSCAKLTLAT
jgi:hypothetical protein